MSLSPNKPPGVDPLAAILLNQWRAWLGYALAGIFALVAIGALWKALGEDRAARWVYVVDGSGSFHAGPLVKVTQGNELFRRMGVRAASAAFLRSATPEGVVYDQLEEIELMFTQTGRRWLDDDVAAQKGDFVARRISQKVYIDETGVATPKGGFILQTVRGRLERSGSLQGRPFRSYVRFAAVLTFVANERLDAAGMYPYLVSDVFTKLEPEELPDERR